MKARNCGNAGFTLTEMLVVIAIIGILAALLLPAITRSEMRAKRIWCINNLNEVGVGFQMFAHDHDSKFPMEVPMSEGGSKEFVQNGYFAGTDFYFAYRHFQALSNEIREPKILACPTDTRQPAPNISSLQNSNVSYFVGVDADYNQPMSILAGDRNITSVSGGGTILSNAPGSQLQWTGEMHQFKGNILFADDHVEQWNNVNFPAGGADASQHQDFFLPTVAGEPTAPPSAHYQLVTLPSASPPTRAQPAAGRSETTSTSQIGTTVSNSYSSREILGEQVETMPTNRAETNSAVTNAAPAAASADDDETMSGFNQSVVKTVRAVAGWIYFLLLLLLMLLLLLWLRRQIRRQHHQEPPEDDSASD